MRVRAGSTWVVMLFACVSAWGCKSERVAKFEKAAQAVCACKDEDCAKKEGAKYVDLFTALGDEKIDWESASGKKDSAAITEVGKTYGACIEKLAPVADANKTCTADAEGKSSAKGCKACCRDEGRGFKYWVDPLAAGALSALGGGKNKGCGCN